MEIRVRSGGVLTLRGSQAGECSLGSGSSISHSDGVIVDGVHFTGGNIALSIAGSSDVLIQRSIFAGQTATGVLVKPNPVSSNVQIAENEFRSDSKGCQRYNAANCSRALKDGTPVAEVD